jgi:GntR family transcriptional regulator
VGSVFKAIDLTDSKPVYRQLTDRVKFAVASGELRPGDRLPSIRDAAVATRVNRNTVAKAYLELEREGVVYTRQGQGCFVSNHGSDLSAGVRRQQIAEKIDEMIAQARLFEIPREKLNDIFAHRLNAIFGDEPDGSKGGKKR